MKLVHIDANHKYFLTAETMADGKPRGTLCDLDGNPIPAGQGHLAREMYMDTLTSKMFVRISHEEQQTLVAAGEADRVHQGAGSSIGWFVEAPDHTLRGHHGDREEEDAAPAPRLLPGSSPPRKAPAKKAAKKAPAKKAAKSTPAKAA